MTSEMRSRKNRILLVLFVPHALVVLISILPLLRPLPLPLRRLATRRLAVGESHGARVTARRIRAARGLAALGTSIPGIPMEDVVNMKPMGPLRAGVVRHPDIMTTVVYGKMIDINTTKLLLMNLPNE